MTIRRAPSRDRWVVIDNDTIRDDRLSWKARGLLAYLLSLPDTWEVSERDLAQRGPDGRSAVATGLRELEDAGYLRRQRHRRADGTFAHRSWVHERPDDADVTPDEAPWPDYPATDEPTAENRAKGSTQDEVPTNRARRRDLVWDAVSAVWGEPTTAGAKSARGKVVRELKREGLDPDEVARRGRLARQRWTEATPNVLLTRWDDLEPPRSVHDSVADLEARRAAR